MFNTQRAPADTFKPTSDQRVTPVLACHGESASSRIRNYPAPFFFFFASHTAIVFLQTVPHSGPLRKATFDPFVERTGSRRGEISVKRGLSPRRMRGARSSQLAPSGIKIKKEANVRGSTEQARRSRCKLASFAAVASVRNKAAEAANGRNK